MATSDTRSRVHAASAQAIDIARRHTDTVTQRGFAVLAAADLRPLMAPAELASFQRAWASLPLDDQMDGGQFRYRSYGRMRLDLGGPEPRSEILPHAPFEQDTIPLWRGRTRVFAPAASEVLQHPALCSLVIADTRLGAAVSGVTAWDIGVHLIRIVARGTELGLPTPEGRHQDGHLFVAMHLLHRSGCEGGESRIYPEPGDPVELTLIEPLTSLFVMDHRVTHEVTPIRSTSPETPGIRDMLLVDLNPAEPAESR